MDEGSTLQLSAIATDSAGNTLAGRSLSWTSDSAAIATVDPNGLVRTLRT